MTTSRSDLGKARVAPILLALAAVLALAACGSGEDDAAATADEDGAAVQADDSSTVDSGDNGGSTEEGASEDSGYTDPYGEPGGRLAVGDTYDDGEYRATYLGLAQLPVGPDIFDGGACFAPLFEVTYLDPYDFGSDQFRPSVDAYLIDGTTAEFDQTGVGCDANGLEPAGYERLISVAVEGGESATGHLSAFHVASGDVADVDLITIYGNAPADGGFEPEVTTDLSS